MFEMVYVDAAMLFKMSKTRYRCINYVVLSANCQEGSIICLSLWTHIFLMINMSCFLKSSSVVVRCIVNEWVCNCDGFLYLCIFV